MKRHIISIEAEYKFPYGGQTGKVNSFLVVDGNETALVDTLVEGKEQQIENALKKAGLGWDTVKHIIITHAHPDHTGSLSAILQYTPHAKVYSGDEIQTDVSFSQVHDGQNIFGLQVIETPGHTQGSIALFDTTLSSILLGDAATNIAGTLATPPPMFTQDMDQAKKSLKKLANLSFNQAFFGHGTPLQNHASEKLKQLI